jgi:protein-S-isoprenylcysteine O-methyltransferase Ste14
MESSWKDEFIVLVFSFPVLVTFIMPLFSESTMEQAWASLAAAPEWYTTIISILVLVIFGLKAIVYKAADKLFDTPKSSSSCKCKK